MKAQKDKRVAIWVSVEEQKRVARVIEAMKAGGKVSDAGFIATCFVNGLEYYEKIFNVGEAQK